MCVSVAFVFYETHLRLFDVGVDVVATHFKPRTSEDELIVRRGAFHRTDGTH